MVSNCLFEAIKAKLKDPKNVKILYWTPFFNKGRWHFLWHNLKDNTVTHYNVKDSSQKTQHFFDGKYKTVSFETYEAFMLDRCKYNTKRLIRIAKSQNFKSLNITGVQNYCYSKDCLPSKEDVEFLEKMLRDYILIKIQYGKKECIKTIDKLPKRKDFYWKYSTPYDEDFIELNGPCLRVRAKEMF